MNKFEHKSRKMQCRVVLMHFSRFIDQETAKKLFGQPVKLPPVTTSLTTQW